MPRGALLPLPQLKLVIPVLVGLIAFSWAWNVQSEPQHIISPFYVNVLVHWTCFLSSLFICVLSFFVSKFDLTNEKKEPCSPYCNVLFMTLAIPGLIAVTNVVDGPSDDLLMVAMAIQLTIVALIYSNMSSKVEPASQPKSVFAIFKQFIDLELGVQIFMLFSIFVSGFAVFPYAWHTFFPSVEKRASGIHGVIALGNAMASLVGYHLRGHFPPRAGMGHIICYVINAIGSILPGAMFRSLILIISLFLQMWSICWDILVGYKTTTLTLESMSAESAYWQDVATQLKAVNGVNEAAIATKSSFLAGLANEMKAIVHGTSMLMSLLNDTDIQPNQSAYLGRLDRAVDRLTNLVREAQYYFEVESQKALDSVPFRLDQMLEEVINSTSIRTNLEERDVDVTYLIDNGVPIGVLGDYNRIKNILLRLLTNAIKATLQGEIIIWVKLGSPNAISSPSMSPPFPFATPTTPTFGSPPVPPLPTPISAPSPSFRGASPNKERRDLKISKLIPLPYDVLATGTSASGNTLLRSKSENSSRQPTSPLASSVGSSESRRCSTGASYMPRSKSDHSPRQATSSLASSVGSSGSIGSSGGSMLSNIISSSIGNSMGSSVGSSGGTSPHNPRAAKASPRPPLAPLKITGLGTHADLPSTTPRGSPTNPRVLTESNSFLGHSAFFGNVIRSSSTNDLFSNYSAPSPPTPAPSTPPSDQSPRIATSSVASTPSLAGEEVVLAISVIDTGIGIPPEDLARIFEPFAMVNRKREDTDLGLGLSICKQLARLFGGNLTVHSELSRGTTFTLMCPFKVNPNAHLPNLNSLFGPGSMLQRAWGVGKTICVIDNNPSIGAACKMHLVPVGCDVIYCCTPTEAISQLKVLVELGRDCDAVLVGYRLYGTNGEETAKVLRSDPLLQKIPVVFMCTAKQRKQVTISNVHFLYKPLKKEQLLTVVHMLCTTQQSAPLDESMTIPEPRRRSTAASPSPSTSHRLHRSTSSRAVMSTLPEVEEEDEPSLPPPSLVPSPQKEIPSPEEERAQETQEPALEEDEEPAEEPSQEPMGVGELQPATPLRPRSPEIVIPQREEEEAPKEDIKLPPSTPPSVSPFLSSQSKIPPFSPPPSLDPPPPSLTPPPLSSPPPSSPPEDKANSNPTPTSAAAPSGTPPLAPAPKKETILLVEDNPINAKIASAVLRRHHFEVELAGNGQIALEKIKLSHGSFQLILMDIHMPVMDGLTCARLVRQFEKEHNLQQIPIIALTADATAMHRAACLEAGCNEFMSKPLDYPLLIEILKKLSSGNML